jgi:branched-chain amino acid transport system substrate-binding protein
MSTFKPTRRAVVGGIAAAASLAAPQVRAQAGPVKIGFSISKTGPNAGGANVTTLIPNYQLWLKEDERRPAASSCPAASACMIDRWSSTTTAPQSEEAVRNDRAPGQPGQGRLPAAALGHRRSTSPSAPVLRQPRRLPAPRHHRRQRARRSSWCKRWPNIVPGSSAKSLGRRSRRADRPPDRSAARKARVSAPYGRASPPWQDRFRHRPVVSAGRPRHRQKAGFQLVYGQIQYPAGHPGHGADRLRGAARLNPDVFLAFSYPPDTLAPDRAGAPRSALNPKVFYTAVGTAFPLYKQRFGANAQGVMGIGGVGRDQPAKLQGLHRAPQPPSPAASPTAGPRPIDLLAALQVLHPGDREGRPVSIKRRRRQGRGQTQSFETILGTIKFVDNQRVDQWWVGQWQQGEFVALAPTKVGGTKAPVFPKPAWPTA